MINPELKKQNRIMIPGIDAVSYEQAFPHIQSELSLEDAVPSFNAGNGPSYITRKDPSSANVGLIDLGNICVQAVLKTIQGAGDNYFSPGITRFLNPPELGLDCTDYPERLRVLTKIIAECERRVNPFDEFSGHIQTSGSILDETSNRMMQFDTTDFFYLMNKDLSYELLINTRYPANELLLNCDDWHHGRDNRVLFEKLRRGHEIFNLFQDGPAEFVYWLGAGCYLPLIGIQAIHKIEGDGKGFEKTTLNRTGIQCQETERLGRWIIDRFLQIPEE